jgi:hypothetical protein
VERSDMEGFAPLCICNPQDMTSVARAPSAAAFDLCAEQARQLEGESPFDNLMEVKS